MNLHFRAALATDVGLIRAKNEDSAFAGDRLILVADGQLRDQGPVRFYEPPAMPSDSP